MAETAPLTQYDTRNDDGGGNKKAEIAVILLGGFSPSLVFVPLKMGIRASPNKHLSTRRNL
ncbi:hypothetical protein D4R75_07895 [bacterium]|nr:MAG: hypothetical protein D4R75_07895 [bacterium]